MVGGTAILEPRRTGVRNPGKLRVVVGRGKGGKQERKGGEVVVSRRRESFIKH